MLTMVSLLLVGGSLGDQFGRRRLFVIGLIAFGGDLDPLRAGPDRGVPDRRAGAAGDRRGAARAGVAGDRRGDLLRRRTRQGGRDVDRVDRDRDRVRAGGRRRAGRADLLAGDLLGQHPADRGDRDADPAVGRGVERSRRLPRHRRARRAALGGGAGGTGLRPDRAAVPRLGRPARLAAAGGGGRLLRRVRALGGARGAADARPLALPHPQLRGGERDDADRLRRASVPGSSSSASTCSRLSATSPFEAGLATTADLALPLPPLAALRAGSPRGPGRGCR